MIHSPSKYTSLSRLKQIKKDNYIGEMGKEYCALEVELLIVEKENEQAMLFCAMAQKKLESMAFRRQVNDMLNRKPQFILRSM